VDTSASTYLNVVNVYSGTALSSLNFVACNYWYSPVTFHASANTTYYIQVGNYFSSGTLNLSVSAVPPPANDDFSSASVISPSSLPFTDSESALASTTEAGEPSPSCAPSPISNSWWYSFTPNSTGSFTATTSSGTWVTTAAYTGSTLSGLSEVACRSEGGAVLTFHATQGTTYYLQISDVYGGNFGPIGISFDHAPQPIANFFYQPGDPSTFDVIQFYNDSTDPGQAGFAKETYDFGDGTSADVPHPNQIGGGPAATHQYGTDGDYTVTDTIITNDGRVASTQQVIRVRTHDVSITQVSVPMAAKAGQTKSIGATVRNSRYPETVRVDFFESFGGGGYQQIGSLTQAVPVRGAQHPTSFTINYTFTAADAQAGKVVFEAVATIIGYRDAFPADNTAYSTPVKVTS
jgi:PKD domain